jgi:hypothetical protein
VFVPLWRWSSLITNAKSKPNSLALHSNLGLFLWGRGEKTCLLKKTQNGNEITKKSFGANTLLATNCENVTVLPKHSVTKAT